MLALNKTYSFKYNHFQEHVDNGFKTAEDVETTLIKLTFSQKLW